MDVDIPSVGFHPVVPSAEPDAHGQAALLLAESILHALVEAGLITNTGAIETVRLAAEVKYEVATVARESEGRMRQSLELLARLQASLSADQIVPRIGLAGLTQPDLR